jgi:hypothetical protein
MKKSLALLALVVLGSYSSFAGKDNPIELSWPADKPAIKLLFGKFQQIYSLAGQSTYVCDVIVENLTDKPVPSAQFRIYGSDKNNVRIGDGLLTLSDLNPHQQVKARFQFTAVGVPSSLTISAKKDMLAGPEGKTIPVRIVSVPPGAGLKVDGKDAGITPVMVRFTVGQHSLEPSKEGYATGTTPFDVTADELPGGSITIELGGISRDTIELRDGTVLLGDVISLSLLNVVISIDGKQQTLDRNQVKKLILVERQTQVQPVVTQPASNPSN